MEMGEGGKDKKIATGRGGQRGAGGQTGGLGRMGKV